MILYYAVGGGHGHLTRARRVLETLRISDAAIVTASPFARDARITGGFEVIEVPRALERARDEHRAWMRELARGHRLIVDTFPGGIQGELRGLGVEMDLVARLLRWEEYRRAVPEELPRFGTAWVVEELTAAHEAFVRGNCDSVVRLELDAKAATAVAALLNPYWLVVHSGPADEVRELIEYAVELRAIEHDSTRIVVASQCEVAGFECVDVYPASSLFPAAKRIVSAAGFNVMLETEAWRDKHVAVPLPRRFDDQFARAARRRTI